MATVNRADTAVNLDQGGAWGGGVAPTSADIATWGSPNITISRNLGASVSWGGIEFLSTQTSAITIGLNAFTLTVGASGINLSASGANLSLTSSTIISLGANQTWNVGSGRTLSLTSVVSSTATNRILTKQGVGTLTLNANNSFGGSGGGLVVNAGLVTGNNNNSFGNASNTVTVASGAAIQVSSVAPVQTAWSISGAGTATSYGALWVSGSTTFGNSTRVVTAQASNTVLSFRAAAAFAGTIALGAGVTSIVLNGENTGTADTNFWTMPTQSNYGGAGTTVTLKSVGLDGVTARGVKYSIGSAANVTDANTVGNGGGGLGNAANAIVIDATGGLHTNSTTTPAFNRSYTFNARGGRLSYGQFKYAALGTVSFNGTLTLSGGTGDYVQLHGNNDPASIIKLNGTITGGANLDIGSNGSNSTVDGTLEIGSALDSSGWSSTAALSVNHIRYGKALANDNAITFGQVATSFIDAVASGVVARHSSYTNTNASAFSFTGTNDLTMTGPVAGSANWTGTTGAWTVSANVLTIGFNFVTAGGLTKAGAGTLALSGNNTGLTGLAWNAGNLRLNSSGAAGSGASASVTIASASGILDNTSGGAVSLNQSGTNALNANFTWTGSADLTFGAGNVTTSATRTITFGSGGGTGTLKFSGAATTATATSNWNIGGSTAGARQRVTLVGANGWAPTSTNASVTAGYFQIQNSNGLGAAVNTTTWYVGMTTAGAATTGAAIELSGGITTPATKNGSFRGGGPNSDGALRSVSGANVWQGATFVPIATLTRFQVDAGSLTLDPAGSPAYTTIAPTNANTPLSFCALSSATLNQQRQLTSSVGTVAVNDTVGASGTVVFSAANSNTGVMTTSAGTAKFTNANGPGNGGNTFPANTTAMVATSNYKAIFVGTTTFGTNGSAAKARLQIGT